MLLGSLLVEGKGQSRIWQSQKLDWDGPAELFSVGWEGWAFIRAPPPTLYHSGIACGLPREGPWPWARQLFPAKAIPKKGWQLREVCQQHSQAARGINPSFQKEIWLAQFSIYFKHSFNSSTGFWLLTFNLYETFLRGFFFLTEFHWLQDIYLDAYNQNVFSNPMLWDIWNFCSYQQCFHKYPWSWNLVEVVIVNADVLLLLLSGINFLR